MFQRMTRRGVATLTIVLALFLAIPAEAGGVARADSPGIIEGAWHWIASWLSTSGLLPNLPSAPGRWTIEYGKDGGAIDPNGGKPHAMAACRDDGGCIDPNG
jgi:hypothetical protein